MDVDAQTSFALDRMHPGYKSGNISRNTLALLAGEAEAARIVGERFGAAPPDSAVPVIPATLATGVEAVEAAPADPKAASSTGRTSLSPRPTATVARLASGDLRQPPKTPPASEIGLSAQQVLANRRARTGRSGVDAKGTVRI